MALLTIINDLAAPSPGHPLVVSLVACAGAALCGRWPAMGAFLAAMGLVGMVPLPAAQTGVAFHAGLVPLFTFARLGHSWRAMVWAVTMLVISTVKTAREVDTANALLSYALAWLLLVLVAGLAGHLIHAAVSASQARNREALQEQRRAMARQLHDTVAHDLTAISMISHKAQVEGHLSPADLDMIVASSRRGTAALRATLNLLHTSQEDSFHEQPSSVALPQLLAESSHRLSRLGLQMNVDMEGDWNTVPSDTAECLSKVLREALNNVEKHADRSHPVAVLVEVTSTSASLVVLNQAHPSATIRNHEPLGLLTMGQRVRSRGGTLEAGLHGTTWTLRASCPLAGS